MINRMPTPNQLHKRTTTLHSFASLQAAQEGSNDQKQQHIPSLLTKFVNLSSQIDIQHNISSFNLIQYEKEEGKVKFDQHIAAAKLKRIENNAELKRANMELFMRKRKMQRIKQQKNKQVFLDRVKQQKAEKQEYQNIFKTFATAQTQKKIQEDNDSIQQQQQKNHTPIVEKPPPPQGILFFDQLKKHPKLLNYTIEKVKEKHIKSDKEKYQKRDRILKFRNQMRTVSHSQPRMNNKDKITLQTNDNYQPQVIFQNIFRKIYTKKNHNRSLSEARNDQRLSTFIHKQEQILQNINEKSLSKQNYKRLKERFNDLLTELYQVDKKHRIQEKYQEKYHKKFNHTIDLFQRRPQHH